MPGEPEFLLLYDEECPVCRASVRAVLGLAAGRIRPVGLRSPLAHRLLAAESPEERLDAFHLIGPDGTHWKGAEALAPLMAHLRWLGPVGSMLRRRAMARRAAARGYAWVTRNRGRLAPFVPASWGRPLERQEPPDVPV